MDNTQVPNLVHDSLVRRMRTMFSLYYDAVDTMSLEQVTHVDQPGRLPIAFSLFHYVNLHDGSFMLITGETPIWNDEWDPRVRPAISGHWKGEPVHDMSRQRIGDYEESRSISERSSPAPRPISSRWTRTICCGS